MSFHVFTKITPIFEVFVVHKSRSPMSDGPKPFYIGAHASSCNAHGDQTNTYSFDRAGDMHDPRRTSRFGHNPDAIRIRTFALPDQPLLSLAQLARPETHRHHSNTSCLLACAVAWRGRRVQDRDEGVTTTSLGRRAIPSRPAFYWSVFGRAWPARLNYG